jgi:hypothetical protein
MGEKIMTTARKKKNEISHLEKLVKNLKRRQAQAQRILSEKTILKEALKYIRSLESKAEAHAPIQVKKVRTLLDSGRRELDRLQKQLLSYRKATERGVAALRNLTRGKFKGKKKSSS